MNYVKQVCEMLGVEINKPFECKDIDGAWYRINKECESEWDAGTNKSCWYVDRVVLMQLLSGVLEVEWKPEYGKTYWFPDFTENDGVGHGYWSNDDMDKNILKRVGAYKTKEEAIEKALELGWVD